MARNKYPEETVKLILDVATHLFVEKGYDATSLQDIINETNLSKGAIYHHFSSKEEIFEAIFHRIGEENTTALAKVRDDKSLNGLEKLWAIFKAALFNSNQSLMLTVTPCLLDNPRFLAMQIAQLYQIVAPKFMYEPHLAAAAELGIRHILCNIWTDNRAFYTQQFGELCRLAAKYGQDVNVEFVTWASVRDLRQAAQLLREVAQPNVGIVVDALHFHRSRVQLQELEALPREWFHFMHLCDTGKEIPTDPKILAHDGREERLYPGEGAVDLKGILSKLPEEIVRGIEVPHSKRLQEAGFEAHARRALEYAKQCLE